MDFHIEKEVVVPEVRESLPCGENVRGVYRRYVCQHPGTESHVRPDCLPYEDHGVLDNLVDQTKKGWVPPTKQERLVLLLAESPPWDYDSTKRSPYFYSLSGESRPTHWLLLRSLGLDENKKNGLKAFRDGGFLLIDVVKCPILKDGLDAEHLDEFVEISSKDILRQEMKVLKPHFVVALGNTAMKGLKSIGVDGLPIGKLTKWMRENPTGKTIASANGWHVLPWFFPRIERPEFFDSGRLMRAIESHIGGQERSCKLENHK